MQSARRLTGRSTRSSAKPRPRAEVEDPFKFKTLMATCQQYGTGGQMGAEFEFLMVGMEPEDAERGQVLPDQCSIICICGVLP